MKQLFAIIDCNNFYVSCERIFDPKLQQQPMVVLSNNDGCIIARSNEAKALGIEMGVPYFQVAAFCKQHHVIVKSANYALYGDLSQRVINIIQSFEPQIEIYSIDEVFISLAGMQHINLHHYLMHLYQRVKQCLGLPISIGVGPTKTLAKIAIHQAKKHLRQPLCILEETISTKQALFTTPVNNVWGIGRKWTRALNQYGIYNAWDLSHLSAEAIRRQFNVVMANTVRELQGYACLSVEQVTPNKKNIITSRSFGRAQDDYAAIATALSHYCARACEKLRQQVSLTQQLQVYLKGQRNRRHQPYLSKTAQVSLPYYTNDTSTIIRFAKQGLQRIFKQGESYHKAGILLCDLIPEDTPQQLDLIGFEQAWLPTKADLQRAHKTLDAINHRFGQSTLYLASEHRHHNATWSTRSRHRSPSYTTCWSDIPLIEK